MKFFFFLAKRSFYFYVFILCFNDGLQSVGAGLLNYDVPEGLCIVDVTTGLYFTMYTPFVYLTFLREFFGYIWLKSSNIDITIDFQD